MEREETNLKTFNTAKKFAEEILFPLMEKFQRYKRQSDFGDEDLDLAKLLDTEIKDIERFNGLKAMNDVLSSLLTAITSTVMLKGNKHEMAKLEETKAVVKKIKDVFYYRKADFFEATYNEGRVSEALNRVFFNVIKDLVESCYINAEILMTKNKLLFADASDEFLTDDELKRSIKEEYVDG